MLCCNHCGELVLDKKYKKQVYLRDTGENTVYALVHYIKCRDTCLEHKPCPPKCEDSVITPPKRTYSCSSCRSCTSCCSSEVPCSPKKSPVVCSKPEVPCPPPKQAYPCCPQKGGKSGSSTRIDPCNPSLGNVLFC